VLDRLLVQGNNAAVDEVWVGQVANEAVAPFKQQPRQAPILTSSCHSAYPSARPAFLQISWSQEGQGRVLYSGVEGDMIDRVVVRLYARVVIVVHWDGTYLRT
jgi:hypothetical protein